MNHLIHLVRTIPLVLALIAVAGYGGAYAEEDGPNASYPQAAVINTDLRAQYFDLEGPVRHDYYESKGSASIN